MRPVTLAAFNSREEAEPVRQYLCAEGIWAEVRSDQGTEAGMEFARPVAGFRIEVPREDFERALQLIYDWNVGPPRSEAPEWVPWMAEAVPDKQRPPGAEGAPEG